VPDWNPHWGGPNIDDKIQLQGSGVLRRLGQGDDPFSALRRTLTAAAPPVYWPFEDAASATTAASGLLTGSALTGFRTGTRFAVQPNCLGSQPYTTYTPTTQPVSTGQGNGMTQALDLTHYNLGSTKVSVGYVFAAFLAPSPHPTEFLPVSIITDAGTWLT